MLTAMVMVADGVYYEGAILPPPPSASDDKDCDLQALRRTITNMTIQEWEVCRLLSLSAIVLS